MARQRTEAQLHADQRKRLRLDGGVTPAKASAFLAEVGVALRYGASDKLPLASMYAAIGDDRKATQATNDLIAKGVAVEINCVADRVGLVCASLVPALLVLRRRNREVDELDLSDTARDVMGFVAATPRPTAGMVRAYLRVPPKTWPNAADEALAELQRWLVIDRGATDVPETGAAYLSKDGIPYRLVDEVHAKHVAAAAKLSVDRAADAVIGAYLGGAVFAVRSKLRSLFKLCLSASEIDASVDRLVTAGAALRRATMIVSA
jgi:hypothetical protein